MKFNSVSFTLCVIFVALTMTLLSIFAYIAYIDMELLLQVFYSKEIVDDSLFDASLSQQENINRAMSTILAWLFLDLFVGLVLAGGITFVLTKRLTYPLNRAIIFAQSISEGDLTSSIQHSRTDEIGNLFDNLNNMSFSLAQLVQRVTEAAGNVNEGAKKLHLINQQLSDSLVQQADRTGNISHAINEVSNAVTEIATSSELAVDSAKASQNTAITGGKAVTDIVQGMTEIQKIVTSGVSDVEQLGDHGKKIAEIISVIQGIAEQTNLLALNAAIEAARAGESGRGFAVVADEVRELATRTANATEEINRSIQSSVNDTQRAISQMSVGSKQVVQSVTDANNAGDALTQIMSSTQKVQSMIEAIAQITEQQVQAASAVAGNVTDINSNIQKSLNGAKESLEAANDLTSKAHSLKEVVAVFKIN